jgi:hypothetical protein
MQPKLTIPSSTSTDKMRDARRSVSEKAPPSSKASEAQRCFLTPRSLALEKVDHHSSQLFRATAIHTDVATGMRVVLADARHE